MRREHTVIHRFIPNSREDGLTHEFIVCEVLAPNPHTHTRPYLILHIGRITWRFQEPKLYDVWSEVDSEEVQLPRSDRI